MISGTPHYLSLSCILAAMFSNNLWREYDDNSIRKHMDRFFACLAIILHTIYSFIMDNTSTSLRIYVVTFDVVSTILFAVGFKFYYENRMEIWCVCHFLFRECLMFSCVIIYQQYSGYNPLYYVAFSVVLNV